MTRPPALPWRGGCQCGAVRYRVRALPLTLYCCHCAACQAQSGSAFAMSMRMERAALEIDWPRMAGSARDAGLATEVVGHFCPRCGTRLVHERPAGADVSLKAGTLDDTSWLRPAGHIWTRRAQPWLRLDAEALAYEGQPPSYDDLVAAWRGGLGEPGAATAAGVTEEGRT